MKEAESKPKPKRKLKEEEIRKAIFIHNALIDQFPEVYIHLKTLWRNKNVK